MSEDQNIDTEATTTETAVDEVEAKEKKAAKRKSNAPAVRKTVLSKDELIDAIKQMTVIELVDLVKALEEEFGVSAAAPVSLAATPAAVGEATPAEEQTEFTVILTSFGESKINVIKTVREITALSLKEAKELVESVPKPVKEGATKDEVASLKEKLEAAGATVEIK
ncbi:MAG TPA: 50S ribosomal protein L7/L12 [Dehalococcoidia bacterium]|nr:50S ribosomal protein L7/L12 [Dehalococcoidia bacterium]